MHFFSAALALSLEVKFEWLIVFGPSSFDLIKMQSHGFIWIWNQIVRF